MSSDTQRCTSVLRVAKPIAEANLQVELRTVIRPGYSGLAGAGECARGEGRRTRETPNKNKYLDWKQNIENNLRIALQEGNPRRAIQGEQTRRAVQESIPGEHLTSASHKSNPGEKSWRAIPGEQSQESYRRSALLESIPAEQSRRGTPESNPLRAVSRKQSQDSNYGRASSR